MPTPCLTSRLPELRARLPVDGTSAGRAGRRSRQGRVILQTKSPDLPLIRQVTGHDYFGLYVGQMEERQMFVYPPFCRLIYVYMKHKRQTCSTIWLLKWGAVCVRSSVPVF